MVDTPDVYLPSMSAYTSASIDTSQREDNTMGTIIHDITALITTLATYFFPVH
ncbi:hypothetical protein [Rhodococcus jostii]|uniref:hypothetical protein n=1 Tax=Rhodococcus jostii TaxID=132919 RepID=UPI00364253F7